MPMPTNLEWLATLPPALQFAVMIGVGIAFGFVARSGYIAGQKEAPVTSKDVVLTAAGITDMQPVRDMASEIKNQTIELRRIGDELGTIRQILAEDAEERQDYRQWRTGFEAGQREGPPPRRSAR
jgi:hypothetical protein